MTRPDHKARARRIALLGMLGAAALPALAVNFPITPQQRGTAQQVAQAGVPLADLAPNAPDTYTVKRGDTLWDISKLFLRTPWRWPELWGMNLDEIRNPHLIFPGQTLFLDKTGGRARLRLAQPIDGTTKLSPRVRTQPLPSDAIASIPLNLIQPFLNEAVVFNTNELAAAPRVVASQESRVVISRGDLAYVLGDLGERRDWRIFRQPKPINDPVTREVLGYEAVYVGAGEATRAGDTASDEKGRPLTVPATVKVVSNRLEVGVGDRLAPLPTQDYSSYMPHAPAQPLDGHIASIYGEGLQAGQNQIVALNKGAQDGMERGHVLALWRAGEQKTDRSGERPLQIKLPDERHGLLFVFRVFERVSYALIVSVQHPVSVGDRFTQP
jgi:hypothetical protein